MNVPVKDQQAVINGLTIMPVLPGRMLLNSDNQPQVTGIKVAAGDNFVKQVPRKRVN